MMVGSALAQVVELIITQYEWFFQNDASLPWDHLLPTTPLGLNLPASTNTNAPSTMERRGKGKKAPQPPSNANVTGSPPPSPPQSTPSLYPALPPSTFPVPAP